MMTIPAVSQVAVLQGPKNIEIKSFPIPEIGDDEILVKVEGCGICGTDVHEYKGDPFGLAPVVLGHEGSGTIAKIGKNVSRDSAGKAVAVGDKVVTCILACGECEFCRNQPGRPNLCENLGVYGLLPDSPQYHLNGWFAEYIVLRPTSTFFVVNDMNLIQRLLIEPAAVVVHSLERAKTTGLLTFNSKVIVQGCGPIGLLQIAIVRAMGVQNIIAIDSNKARLAFAQKMGASTAVNISEYDGLDALVAAVKDVTDGYGADFAFQCTGVPQAAANLWKFVKRGGGLCEVGFFVDNGPCTVNPHLDFCNKEITAVGSWVYTVQDYPTAFDFIRRATEIGLPLEELVTHRYPLAQLAEAMEVNIRQEGVKIAYIA